MVAIDYIYVANWSLWTDIKILMRTIRHVLGRNRQHRERPEPGQRAGAVGLAERGGIPALPLERDERLRLPMSA